MNRTPDHRRRRRPRCCCSAFRPRPHDADWKRGRVTTAASRLVPPDAVGGTDQPERPHQAEWSACWPTSMPRGKDSVTQNVSVAYRASIKATNKAAEKFATTPDRELLEDLKAFLVKGARDGDSRPPAREAPGPPGRASAPGHLTDANRRRHGRRRCLACRGTDMSARPRSAGWIGGFRQTTRPSSSPVVAVHRRAAVADGDRRPDGQRPGVGRSGGVKYWGDALNNLIGWAADRRAARAGNFSLHRMSLMNLTLVLGAFAALSGQFGLHRPPADRIPLAALGGILMGIGAALAGGCTTGGFFNPVLHSSPAGWVMGVGLLAGARWASSCCCGRWSTSMGHLRPAAAAARQG